MCSISPITGTTNTLFTINCNNWLDKDGEIISYSYYGKINEYFRISKKFQKIFYIIFFQAKYSNDSLHYGLGYSWNSSFVTKIFSGAVYDSYKIQIHIQIYDNDVAFTTFEIEQPIIVMPDLIDLQLIKEKLILADTTFIDNIILNEGDYLNSIQVLQSISSLINDESLSDKLSLTLNETIKFPELYGPLSNYAGVSPVSIY
jgi:hypothetical protein